MPSVETKGGAEAVRRNDSASRPVVSREALLKFGDRSALDATKRLPGLARLQDEQKFK